MNVGGKRSIDGVTGATESGAAKRRRTEEADGGAEPVVGEHSRWEDLPCDIFCYLAPMLLLPEYLGLRLVSRRWCAKLHKVGPVATRSRGRIEFDKGWEQRVALRAAWCSHLKLSQKPSERAVRLAEILSTATGWSSLCLSHGGGGAGDYKPLLALLQALDERLPARRGVAPRLLHMKMDCNRPPIELLHVMKSLKGSGKLLLSRLDVMSISSSHLPLLEQADFDRVTLRRTHSIVGQKRRIAEALALLGNGGSVRQLRVEIKGDAELKALIACTQKKQVDFLQLTAWDLGLEATNSLVGLPVHELWLQYVQVENEQALLEAVTRNRTLKVLTIADPNADEDTPFFRACRLIPHLKKFSSYWSSFEALPETSGGLRCTRIVLTSSAKAAQAFKDMNLDLGLIRSLSLEYVEHWDGSGLPGRDFSAWQSLRRLRFEVSEALVFPWDCLSLEKLSVLALTTMGEPLIFSPMPEVQVHCPQLRKLKLGGDVDDVEGLLALLRQCPALEDVKLRCSFSEGAATATARVIIAAFELANLESLDVFIESEALYRHCTRGVKLKSLKPRTAIRFESVHSASEPGDATESDVQDQEGQEHSEDLAQAIALVDKYYASKTQAMRQ